MLFECLQNKHEHVHRVVSYGQRTAQAGFENRQMASPVPMRSSKGDTLDGWEIRSEDSPKRQSTFPASIRRALLMGT